MGRLEVGLNPFSLQFFGSSRANRSNDGAARSLEHHVLELQLCSNLKKMRSLNSRCEKNHVNFSRHQFFDCRLQWRNILRQSPLVDRNTSHNRAAFGESSDQFWIGNAVLLERNARAQNAKFRRGVCGLVEG